MDRITPAAQDPSQDRRSHIRVIGVIDLQGGRAVHARGGNRASYLPVSEVAGTPVNGDAVALARAYVDGLGVRELYVADLDAIGRGIDAMQSSLVADIARLGVPVWADAGVSTPDEALLVRAAGASIIVVGLETLPDFDTLEAICSSVARSHVAFSLDLRDRVPIRRPNVVDGTASPVEVAASAARAGATHIIVLDLARVGTGARIDLDLIASIRAVVGDVALFGGGGVKDASDLAALASAGCDGALVATALLTGALNV